MRTNGRSCSLQVLLECNGVRSRVRAVERLLSRIRERGIEESSLLELLQEAGESAIDSNQLEELRNSGGVRCH